MAQTTNISVDVVENDNNPIDVKFETQPEPATYLYYSMQFFYANRGGPCYVVSLGPDTDHGNITKQLFVDALALLEGCDEPTILVFPDACLLSSDVDHGDVINSVLIHCNKMQDRFAIVDVRKAIEGGTDNTDKVNTNFRDKVSSDVDLIKYGAAYFPYQ